MTSSISQPPRSARRHEGLALAMTLLGLGVSVAMGLASDGFYMDDDLTHYMMASDGWTNVNSLLHRWGRPGFTIPMAVAAHLGGLAACRILSALMTAAAAYLAWRIARRLLGSSAVAAFVPLLVWVQPMVFKLSLTTLTETPGLLYLTAGVWLYLRGNRIAGCALVSLLFITRDETMAMAPLMAVAVLYDAWRIRGRNMSAVLTTWWVWACAAACVWAIAAYWLAAWIFHMPPDASPLNIFGKTYTSEYGRGTWLHYVGLWPDAAGLGVLVLAVAGAIYLRGRAWLITAWTFGLVALHTLIYARGMFESGGYSRFLVPIGGLLAVLAGGGLQAVLAERRRFRMIVLFAAAVWMPVTCWVIMHQWNYNLYALLLPPAIVCAVAAVIVGVNRWPSWQRRAGWAVVVIALCLQIPRLSMEARPLRLSDAPFHRLLLDAHDQIAARGHGDNRAYSKHVFLQAFRPNTHSVRDNTHLIELWKQAKPGTLFFWENKYATNIFDTRCSDLQAVIERLGQPIYDKQCPSPYASQPDPHVIVFERNDRPAEPPETSR